MIVRPLILSDPYAFGFAGEITQDWYQVSEFHRGFKIYGGYLALQLYRLEVYKVLYPGQPIPDPLPFNLDLIDVVSKAPHFDISSVRLRGHALANKYRKAVIGVLDQVTSTQTGATVIDEIAAHRGRQVMITPYFPEEGETEPNAVTSSTGSRAPEDVIINFTPSDWGKHDPELVVAISTMQGDAYRPVSDNPDEVLLHELVHALMVVTGTSLRRRVPFQGRRYKTESRNKEHPERRGPYEMDEFMAILITNIHSSERGAKLFRHSHTDHKGHALTPEAFLDIGMNRAHVRLLRRKQPRLFNALNDIDAPWNPLKGFRDSILA